MIKLLSLAVLVAFVVADDRTADQRYITSLKSSYTDRNERLDIIVNTEKLDIDQKVAKIGALAQTDAQKVLFLQGKPILLRNLKIADDKERKLSEKAKKGLRNYRAGQVHLSKARQLLTDKEDLVIVKEIVSPLLPQTNGEAAKAKARDQAAKAKAAAASK